MVHSCYEITALNFYLSNGSRCVRVPHTVITEWCRGRHYKFRNIHISSYCNILEVISFICREMWKNQ